MIRMAMLFIRKLNSLLNTILHTNSESKNMDIKDLKIGDKVTIHDDKFFNSDKCKRDANGNYSVIGNKCIMFSGDMYAALVGKAVEITGIDKDDSEADVLLNGFWGSSLWIKELYKEKPVVRRAQKKDNAQPERIDVPTHALNGKKFGPIFTYILKTFKDIPNLSSNTLSTLSQDEISMLCEKFDVDQKNVVGNLIENLMAAIITHKDKNEA